MPAQWDGAAKNSNIGLSNGGLTATGSGTPTTHYAGRSAAVVAAGAKKRWEITVQAGTPGFGVGVCSASETFADGDFLGGQANSYSYFSDGSVYSGGVQVAALAAYVVGNVIGLEAEGGNRVWFSVNGAPVGNLSIAGFGDIYPAYNLWSIGAQTANFGATAFAFVGQAGFTGFDSPLGAVTLMGQVVMG